MKSLWIGALSVAYLLYVIALLEAGGFRALLAPQGLVLPAVILVWIGPLCLFVLWKNRAQLTNLDMHMAWLPFVVWFVAAGWFFRSITGFGSMFFQFSLVSLVGATCLSRFLVAWLVPSVENRKAAVGFAWVWMVATLAIALLAPPIAD